MTVTSNRTKVMIGLPAIVGLAVAAVLILVFGGDPDKSSQSAADGATPTASHTLTKSYTPTPTTTTSPTPIPLIITLTCTDDVYTEIPPFTLSRSTDWAAVWAAGPATCEAARSGGDLT